MDDQRDLLRHTLATLAYRGAKPLRDAPADFAATRACPTCRSAGEILAHIGDLLDWALTAARGEMKWTQSPHQTWDADVARFFAALQKLDDFLASDAPLSCPEDKLFQGPIADAFTHVGQLATLRRLAGAPVRGENYYAADIAVGRVGAEQAPPRMEFD
jgi:hypothetical protein